MELFVVQRNLPVPLLMDARREYDKLRAAVHLQGQEAIEIIAALYLSGPGRSLTIVAAESREALAELLTRNGIRHSTISHATAFPGSDDGSRRIR